MSAPTVRLDDHRDAVHWATIYARRYSRPYAILSVRSAFFVRPLNRSHAFAAHIADIVEADHYNLEGADK